MRILISNDDGVHAPGIIALAAELSTIAQIDVVAPDRNRSGASNSLTIESPLRPRLLANGFSCIDGTPSDCIHLALGGYLTEKPDLVVSGINEGPNLGDDVIYSGTVAAAIGARIAKIPSIAVSLAHANNMHYKTAAIVAKLVVGQLQKNPLPAATILNVNVPDLPLSELRGFEVTRLGSRHYAEPILKGKDPRQQTIYWVGPPGPGVDAGPGTDFHAVESGFVSITPLQVDFTNFAAFEQVSQWTMGLTVK